MNTTTKSIGTSAHTEIEFYKPGWKLVNAAISLLELIMHLSNAANF